MSLKVKKDVAQWMRRNREGQTVPMDNWICECGRRFRGDVRLIPHFERAGHHVARNTVKKWSGRGQ